MNGRNKRMDGRRDVDLDGHLRTGGGPAGRRDYQGVQEIIVHSAAETIYTCPMHPEVQQDHPGDCPKCGMTQEARTVTAGTDDEALLDRRRTHVAGVRPGDGSLDSGTGRAVLGG